jgi:hypothetical protein
VKLVKNEFWRTIRKIGSKFWHVDGKEAVLLHLDHLWRRWKVRHWSLFKYSVILRSLPKMFGLWSLPEMNGLWNLPEVSNLLEISFIDVLKLSSQI